MESLQKQTGFDPIDTEVSLKSASSDMESSQSAPFDMEARHIIEALRSGIPSRAVGRYFSEARPKIMKELSGHLDAVCETGHSSGIIITGKYGEGKTHLLNTVFCMAHSANMVVSYLSLGRETPMDKLYLVYQKIIRNTYLPQRQQPGFMQVLEELTPNGRISGEMLAYAAKQLETDKLYYLLRSYLNTDDTDERFLLQADLEGDFIANANLKRIYKRIFSQPAKYNVNFSKTRHCGDYFAFMSHLFKQLGYQGWVILIDETELMGRLGRKARLNAYRNIAAFLFPNRSLEAVLSVFALSSSYAEDVIEGKHEYDNLAELYPDSQEPIRSVLTAMTRATQLAPLTRDEINEVLRRIREYHGRAYRWNPNVPIDVLAASTKSGGYLLRTKIRAAIEYLDQLYQYGDGQAVSIRSLDAESFEEDVPSLEAFAQDADV